MKYKFSILCAVLFTIPLLGYFVVSGYLWIFAGSVPDVNKIMTAFSFGIIALYLNLFLAIEIES